MNESFSRGPRALWLAALGISALSAGCAQTLPRGAYGQVAVAGPIQSVQLTSTQLQVRGSGDRSVHDHSVYDLASLKSVSQTPTSGRLLATMFVTGPLTGTLRSGDLTAKCAAKAYGAEVYIGETGVAYVEDGWRWLPLDAPVAVSLSRTTLAVAQGDSVILFDRALIPVTWDTLPAETLATCQLTPMIKLMAAAGDPRGGGLLGIGRPALPGVTAAISATKNVIVHRRAAALKPCYATALLNAPQIKGQMDVVVQISSRHGRATRVDIARADGGLDPVKSCLMRVVRRWRFPTADAPEVRFTVDFAPTTP